MARQESQRARRAALTHFDRAGRARMVDVGEKAETVERVRGASEVQVAVGFGISTGEQARAVGELADGVIVGSRIVRAAGEGGAAAVGSVVGELAEALRF